MGRIMARYAGSGRSRHNCARRARHVVALALIVWLVTLFGAGDASAHPTITVTCTPAPEDCSGWYRSDVTVDWIVTDFSEEHPVLERRL